MRTPVYNLDNICSLMVFFLFLFFFPLNSSFDCQELELLCISLLVKDIELSSHIFMSLVIKHCLLSGYGVSKMFAQLTYPPVVGTMLLVLNFGFLILGISHL